MIAGQVVTRMLGGYIPMELKVTEVTDAEIICGPWRFDKETGVEIDEDIGVTVSHLLMSDLD
jgi:hypothetical protein